MKKNFECEQNFYCLFSQFLHSLDLPLTSKFRGSNPKSLMLICNADKTLQGRNQEDYLYIKKKKRQWWRGGDHSLRGVKLIHHVTK